MSIRSSNFFLLLITGILLGAIGISCQSQPDAGEPTSTQPNVRSSGTAKVAQFSDIDRARKITEQLSSLPVIYANVAMENNIPGIAFGVVVDTALVYSGGVGVINLETSEPVTSRSMFRIASMTKSFTAMAILKLRDEGRLSLSDQVSAYLPELADLVYLTADASPVTIENLLTMTAGFPEDNPWGDRFLDLPDSALMRLVEEGISFSGIPSNQYEYSNLGYGLLGQIIKRVTGTPFQEYISGQILLPLGMENTAWEFDGIPDGLFARGYRWEDQQWKEEPILHDGAFGAMGGLITSIEDFSKYVAFHLSAWPPRDDPEKGPVKRSSVREMMQMTHPGLLTDRNLPGNEGRDAIAGYGYGLRIILDADGVRQAGHGGGLPGYGSYYSFYPDHGIGIMAFGNLTYTGSTLRNAYYEVIGQLMDNGLFHPRLLPVSDILRQRKEEVTELIRYWDPQLESEILAANFFLDQDREHRMEHAERMLSSIGEIRSIGELVPENQLRGSFSILGESGELEIFFTLTPEPVPKLQYLTINN